jgi:hypothetical protein
MREAIFTLRVRAVALRKMANHEGALECDEAADLLERVLKCAADQAGQQAADALVSDLAADYAKRDSFLTMALFVGVPDRAARKFADLVLYIKELDAAASKKESS